jgi:hypothetical protein
MSPEVATNNGSFPLEMSVCLHEPVTDERLRGNCHVQPQARDLVVLERSKDSIAVHFSDSPLGRAEYDIIIRFGP